MLGESLRVTSSNDCLVWFQRRQRGAFQTPEGFRCRRHRSFHGSEARETEKIIELGNDSARQADYIKSVLDQHVAAFLDSKECDGKSFPDFVGALILEEIPSCLALRTKYRAYKQEEALKRQAEQEEQDRAFCEERNRKAEQMIDLAIRTIRGGGTLKK